MKRADLNHTLRPSGLKSPLYRPEIDGLRALAVVAVVIYHFNRAILPGGYLGVDIFFVISGFVITASLARNQGDSSIEFLLKFYERRIRRLVPALLICVVITSLLLCLFDPIPAIRLGTAWRSMLGFSNIMLYNLSTDYFSSSTEINPFTHTWSLSIEAQFYLFFPFILLWTGFVPSPQQGAKALFRVIGALSIASLMIFFYQQSANQPAAFFLLPARFWQLGAGCLLFLTSINKTGCTWRWGYRLYSLLGLTFLAAMVGLMLLPISFQGVTSFAMVMLATALLASIGQGTPSMALLTHPWLVLVGLLSYSLYLWHWSVLVLSRWTIGIHWWTIPFQIALILLLAWVSYRVIERPMRSHPWSTLRWRSIAYGITACFLAAAGILGLSRGASQRLFLGERKEQRQDLATGETKPATPEDLCRIDKNYRILFVGDSHANHYRASTFHGCNTHQMLIQVSSTAGMPYPPVSYTNSATGHDFEANLDSRQAMEYRWRAIPTPHADSGVVILSLRGSLYFSEAASDPFLFRNTRHQSMATGEPISGGQALQQWITDLGKLVSSNKHSNFILILPTPEFQDAYPIETCTPQWFRPFQLSACLQGTERSRLEAFNKKFQSALRRTLARHNNLYLFDAFSVLCPPSQRHCPRMLHNTPLYLDKDHLSEAGANQVLDALVIFLRQQQLGPDFLLSFSQ